VTSNIVLMQCDANDLSCLSLTDMLSKFTAKETKIVRKGKNSHPNQTHQVSKSTPHQQASPLPNFKIFHPSSRVHGGGDTSSAVRRWTVSMHQLLIICLMGWGGNFKVFVG
jgi:hypothetical protein